jgi:type IV pilus assembly protein PilV
MADTRRIASRFHAGFTLVEVLVALIIVLLGLLGAAGLQTRAHQAEFESYQRAQALILMEDIANRVLANRPAARCYAFSNPASGSPYAGDNGSATVCSGWGDAQTRALANNDMADWHQLLLGASETRGGQSVGAMVAARGCVYYDEASDTYTVAVAWQGLAPTAAPTVSCANDTYGTDQNREQLRRVVSMSFRIPPLS